MRDIGTADVLDFEIGGVVLVRLEGATPADADVVIRQIGPPGPAIDREPDLTIRFVDRLNVRGPLRHVGLGEAGFTDDAFLVLRARQKSPARVRLPLENAGDPAVIECERGLRSVPYLVPLINLAALRHDVVPAHAAAFVHQGRGVLVVGWSKGGKTETLLAFMAHGASFVGDEWLYLRPDGTATGLPEPGRVWDWQLAQYPAFRRRVARSARVRLTLTRTVADAMAAGLAVAPLRRSPVGRLLERTEPIVRRQSSVQVPPDRLYGGAIVRRARIDDVLLVVSRADNGFHVLPADPGDVAERVAISNHHERRDLLALYDQFRFAFPGTATGRLETTLDRERDLLRAFFAGRRAHRVEHPYPLEIERLHALTAPLLEADADGKPVR